MYVSHGSHCACHCFSSATLGVYKLQNPVLFFCTGQLYFTSSLHTTRKKHMYLNPTLWIVGTWGYRSRFLNANTGLPVILPPETRSALRLSHFRQLLWVYGSRGVRGGEGWLYFRFCAQHIFSVNSFIYLPALSGHHYAYVGPWSLFLRWAQLCRMYPFDMKLDGPYTGWWESNSTST